MSAIISTIIFILTILITISFFHPKIIKLLNLKRIRNSYGLFCLFLGLIILDEILLYGITTGDIITFVVGAIVGIPFGIYTVHDAFKRIEDNTLYFERKGNKGIYIFLLLAMVAMGVGIAMRRAGITETQIVLLWRGTWIFLFPSAVTSFLEIVRYEKKHGPIYIEFRKHNT